jgi:hypothetical protein
MDRRDVLIVASEHRIWHDENEGISAVCWKCAAHIHALVGALRQWSDLAENGTVVIADPADQHLAKHDE